MSTRTLPVVKSAVVGRLMKIGELIDDARSGLITADNQLLDAFNTMPTLQPPQR